MSENNLKICVWPQQEGVSAMRLVIEGCPEYLMGSMEYPNRTADPQEQTFKRSRL